jgi:hypothetical protein
MLVARGMKGCSQQNQGCVLSGVSPSRLIGPNTFLKEQDASDGTQKSLRDNSKRITP